MLAHTFGRASRELAVEQSLDAAMEVQQVIAGSRSDAPALQALVMSLLGTQAGQNPSKKELLSDARVTSLYHRAASLSGREYNSVSELDDILDLLFRVNAVGLTNFSGDNLQFIRDFCLGLNRQLVGEAFSRTPEPPVARIRRRG